jgi:CO/xanthine dehydrogenase FAD-binding subunit
MDLTRVETHRYAVDRGDLSLRAGEHVLAGGTWLFSAPQPEITGLVDLTSLGWAPWEELPDQGLRLGATCTIAQAQQAPWPGAGLVRQCADALLMSFKVQSAATVGGNLCLALPAGAMIALTAAFDGEVLIWTRDGGERRTPVAEFVGGPEVADLLPGEVVRAVDLPAAALSRPTALRRASLTTHGRTGALVIGRAEPGAVVLTLTGSVPRPVVLTLPAGSPEPVVREAVTAAGAGVGWYDDPHGAPDWRAAQTARLAVEVCAELAERSP